MGAFAEVKREWKLFKDDHPGERFRHHRERMQHKPRGHSILMLAVGIVLVAGGIVLLFIPGPGSVLIVFGLGLIASHSTRLSDLMDRGEPALRRFGHRVVHRWKGMPGAAKLSVITSIALLGFALCLCMWKFVVSAYLLG